MPAPACHRLLMSEAPTTRSRNWFVIAASRPCLLTFPRSLTHTHSTGTCPQGKKMELPFFILILYNVQEALAPAPKAKDSKGARVRFVCGGLWVGVCWWCFCWCGWEVGGVGGWVGDLPLIYIYIYMCMCMYMYVRVCIHTYITYTHTHVHIVFCYRHFM
jgi:hypothetical protein